MSALDSRALTYLDCFFHRFDEPGTVRYAVGGPLAACLTIDELRFTLTIEKGDGEQRQHHVEVRHRDGSFTVVPKDLVISAGDVVLWHTSSSTSPPFGVWGRRDGDEQEHDFSSASLTGGSVYSHAFGSPGSVSWTDAEHGRVGGTIVVRDLDMGDADQCRRWAGTLTEGIVVTVQDDRAEPAELEIVTGQTVFFAIADGEGVTVTEKGVQEGFRRDTAEARSS